MKAQILLVINTWYIYFFARKELNFLCPMKFKEMTKYITESEC